ncbi:MAG TPA: MFS transporter [Stellaceae bacterium]
MTHAVQSRSHGLPAAIVATSLGFVVVQVDVSIVNVALPEIGGSLGMGVAGLQWVVDAYTLAFASLLLSAGSLGDRIGARKTFVAGFALFVAASLGCGLAGSAAALIAARAVQGVGAAVLVPCSLALLNHACGNDATARARAIGLWTAAGAVALSAGPVLGGMLVDTLGWPSIFLVNVPVGTAGLWLTLRFVEETPVERDGSRELDLPGQALAVLTLFALTGAVIEAGSRGWHAPLVLSGLALAVLSGIGFAIVEVRSAAPMLPLGFFRQPTFGTASLVGLLINLTVYGTIFVLSLYFQQVRRYSPVVTGFAFLPFMAAAAVSNVLGGRLAGGRGPRLPIVAGLLVGAAGYWLLHELNGATPYPAMLPGLLLVSLGVGLAVPPMTSALLSTVHRSRSGVASGVLNTVRQAGGAIGVALFGSVTAGGVAAGAQLAFRLSSLLLVLAAISAVAGIRRQVPESSLKEY